LQQLLCHFYFFLHFSTLITHLQINISDPTTGASKVIDIEDEKKYHIFFDKRISQEVDVSPLGEEFDGYVVKITGGSDKQGFGMKQGVLVNHRVRLLLDGTTSGFHTTRSDGQRKRKTVRGCIVSQVFILFLVLVSILFLFFKTAFFLLF
jgi:small subunit ribosomal protein S6e